MEKIFYIKGSDVNDSLRPKDFKEVNELLEEDDDMVIVGMHIINNDAIVIVSDIADTDERTQPLITSSK